MTHYIHYALIPDIYKQPSPHKHGFEVDVLFFVWDLAYYELFYNNILFYTVVMVCIIHGVGTFKICGYRVDFI